MTASRSAVAPRAASSRFAAVVMRAPIDGDSERQSSPKVALRSTTCSPCSRDIDVHRAEAAKRQAEPATGEATASGPATVDVKDGGAGVRFNFPGTGTYRPIEWDEWLQNFDDHECAFVFDNDASAPMSSRYRIVKAAEWKDFLR